MKRGNRTAYHYKQVAAADIAIRLIVANRGEFIPFIDEIVNDYGLHYCPFTRLPCSSYDYEEACKEYDRQIMEAAGYDF